jgi:radical SAM-linked protein
MAGRQQPEQHAPPVQRLRVRYAKRGRARFTSHRDFARAFERALRRAGIPMAYTSGFSPHPRVSYANASPTGAATEAEYLEIGVARECDPELVRAALDSALPPGLDIVAVVEATGGGLVDRLTGSVWQVEPPQLTYTDPLAGEAAAELDTAIAALLASEAVVVQRMTRNGLRTFDVRQALVAIRRRGACLEMTLRHGEPLVRPDDVLRGLRILHPNLPVAEDVLLTRLRHGALDEGTGQVADLFG